MFTAGNDDPVGAASDGDEAKAGQAIGKHREARCQVLRGRGAVRPGAEAQRWRELGTNRIPRLAQGNRCDDRELAL